MTKARPDPRPAVGPAHDAFGSLEQMRDFIALTSDWLWETDAEHRFTMLSDGYEEHTGNSPANLIGLTRWETAADLDDADKWLRHRATLEAHLPFSDFEYRIDAPGGDRGWRRVSGKPIRAADGAFLGYRGVARDVTDARTTQVELQRSRLQLADAIDSLAHSFVLFDADDRIILHNAAFLSAFPFMAEDGRPEGLTHDDFLDRALAAGHFYDAEIGYDRATWLAAQRARHNSPDGQPVEQKLSDGRWLRTYDKRMSDGGVVSVSADISKLKHAEQLLLDAFESSESGIAVFGSDDRLVLCNSAYRDVWRPYADHVLPGITFRRMCELSWEHGLVIDPDEDRDAWIARRVAEHRSGMATIDRQLSSSRWVRVIERLTESGGIVSIVSDISELKRQKAEIESIAYSVTHDLKAPLRAVISFTELVREDCRGAVSAETAEYIDDILKSANRMAELLSDLLEFSKLGGSRFERKKLSLRDLLVELVNAFQSDAASGAHRITLNDEDCTISADKTVLSRVFQNLIDNAIKFTRDQAAPDIRIEIKPGQHFATVHVSDNGIGIPATFNRQIFEMFKRLHTDDEYPGTGLGLSVVKKGVDMHEGFVDIVSEVGEGATFSIHLPVEPFVKG